MGAPSAQVQSPQSSSGKGIASSQGQETSSGKGSPSNQQYEAPEKMQGAQGTVTFPSQGGQPEMGMPNAYSNTIQNGQNLLDSQGSWDNSPKSMGGGKGSSGSSGKGKGA